LRRDRSDAKAHLLEGATLTPTFLLPTRLYEAKHGRSKVMEEDKNLSAQKE
jgi:hypothetical protein